MSNQTDHNKNGHKRARRFGFKACGPNEYGNWKHAQVECETCGHLLPWYHHNNQKAHRAKCKPVMRRFLLSTLQDEWETEIVTIKGVDYPLSGYASQTTAIESALNKAGVNYRSFATVLFKDRANNTTDSLGRYLIILE